MNNDDDIIALQNIDKELDWILEYYGDHNRKIEEIVLEQCYNDILASFTRYCQRRLKEDET